MKPRTWMLLSLLLFAASAWLWQLGLKMKADQTAPTHPAAVQKATVHGTNSSDTSNTSDPSNRAKEAAPKAVPSRKSYVLSNTPATKQQLERNPHGLILRNALLDTAREVKLDIPTHLQAHGAPGSYLVQSDRPLNAEFYAAVAASGAKFVSYIPNNAALVQATPAQAKAMAADPVFQAVLPYEPYFKLDGTLLPEAVNQTPMLNSTLRVTVFPGQEAQAMQGLAALGGNLMGTDQTPFGPTLIVHVPPHQLAAVAQLPQAWEIEAYSPRRPLNDLTRVRLGVSTNTLIATPNYLNLSGQGIWIGLNDTGVDGTHPDFSANRLKGDTANALKDFNGHGTHVAGTIAGSGSQSGTVSNGIPGSVSGASFRGLATSAALYVQQVDMTTGPYVSDAYLVTNGWLGLRTNSSAAGGVVTNGFIVNNSWGYQSTIYDLAAASYDAAARDAEPGMPGEQSLLLVFAAGDLGGGASSSPDNITSPGTLKNGITVGAMDSPRFITNTATIGSLTNYAVFESDTFDDNEVAGFSSGGNVAVGVEGASGRFKPDVVAPGAFIISDRATDFVDPTNVQVLFYLDTPGQSLPPGATNIYAIDVTTNTESVLVQVLPNDASPVPFPGLLAYFDTNDPPVTPLTATNLAGVLVSSNPAPGIWYLALVNPAVEPQPVNFDLKLYAITNGPYGTTNWTNSYYYALSNLNSALKPSYRYETGTSMAAAAVSGLLGLVQQYLISNYQAMPSPALLKALLINGSSSLNNQLDFNPAPSVNLQGWGLPNLQYIVPAIPANSANSGTSSNSTVYYDQSPTNALQTGQSQVYQVNISDPNALNYPLLITLVWTDPPGNPAAGKALVNNLELTVYDSTGTNVFVGNDFLAGDVFTSVTNISNPVTAQQQQDIAGLQDVVNNVQNVYLDASYGLSSNYYIVVQAAQVHVNAVTTLTNAIAQDYALVVSSEDPAMTAPFTVTPLSPASLVGTGITTNPAAALVTPVTSGAVLLHQRVGANNPDLYENGTNYTGVSTNGNVWQWHFFVLTNTVTGTNALYTNAFFTTFLPPTLTFPDSTPPNLSVPAANDADIDLYVSTNPAMLALNNTAVRQSSKAVGTGGNKTVFFTNTYAGQVFYIGVKSETQQGADFAFFAEITTNFPSSQNLGPVVVFGTPVPAVIPDSYLGSPGAYVIAPMASGMTIRKAVVGLEVAHSNPADVIGTIQLNGTSATLNHYTGPPGGFTNWYDDRPDGSVSYMVLQQGTLPAEYGAGTVPSEGPGSLLNFVGKPAAGAWVLTESDAAPTQSGQVNGLVVVVWPQPPNPLLFTVTIPPLGWYYGYVDVPNDATNLNIAVSAFNPAFGGPAGIYVTNTDSVNLGDYGVNPIPSPGGAVDVPNTNMNLPLAGTVNPPPPALAGGVWYYGITNESTLPLTLTVTITIEENLTPNLNVLVANGTPTPLATDAHTQSQICVDSGLLTNNQQLVDLQVGVRINDTNLDDLVLTLTSPQGTSVQLFENRGGSNATQLGLTTSNGTLYTTFTEDASAATPLIKFAPLPYAQSFTAVTVTSNSFEGDTDGDYGLPNGFFSVLGNNLDGWTVTTNAVAVVGSGDLYYAPSGTNFLALADGTITRTIPTVVGRSYTLTNLYRGSGLVDWWPFEGDANDIIGTNNGVMTGHFTNVNGAVGQALQFNAVDTEINFGPDAANFGTSDFTIEFWLNTIAGSTQTKPDGMTVLSKGLSPVFYQNYLYITLQPESSPDFLIGITMGDLSGSFTFGAATLSPGVWHHIAFERRSNSGNSTMYIYVDGKFENDYQPPFLINVDNSDPLLMGSVSGLSTNFFGAVDELDFWNRGLTDAEVAAIYCAGTNGVGKATPVSIYPNIQYQINGAAVTNLIASNNAAWATNALLFTAASNTTTLSIKGNPQGMLLDDFIVIASPTNANLFLPEEPLSSLNGENPAGCWTLDIWDTRADSSAISNGVLLSWNMQMTISSTNAHLIVLTNGVPYTNGAVSAGGIQYFAFDVPTNASYVTNTLSKCSPPLNLLFNQTELPTGFQPGDYTLLANAGTLATNVLSNSLPPSLMPGSRYYLGVENTNATAATFTIEAQYNNVPPYATNIILLTEGVPYTAKISNAVAGAFQAYYFPVPTNAVLASFEIINPTNELNLFVNNTLPLPNNTSYDYAAAYADSNDESVVVTTNSAVGTVNSSPIPLSAGNWYLTVYNYSATQPLNTFTYQIEASWVGAAGISVIPLTNRLTQGVFYTNGVSSPGPALTNFYSFTISSSVQSAQFVVTNVVGGNVDLLARLGGLPTPQQMTLGSFSPGNDAPQIVTIVTNAELPSLIGTWYLAVPNNASNSVSYMITAATNVVAIYNFPAVAFTGLAAPSLTNGFSISWESAPGASYEVDLTTNLESWTTATNFTTTNSNTTYTDPTPIGTQSARFYRIYRTK